MSLADLKRCPECKSADVWPSGNLTLPWKCWSCNKAFLEPFFLSKLTSPELAEVKETTLNELGAAVGRLESRVDRTDTISAGVAMLAERLRHIENKLDELGESLDADFSTHATNSVAQYNELRDKLNVIISGMIEHLPESPRLKQVRRAVGKGKRR